MPLLCKRHFRFGDSSVKYEGRNSRNMAAARPGPAIFARLLPGRHNPQDPLQNSGGLSHAALGPKITLEVTGLHEYVLACQLTDIKDHTPMTDPIQMLITLPFPENLVSEIQNTSPRLKVTVRPAKAAEEIDPATWEKTEILYTADILPAPEAVPALRWIQFHWAGVDSLLKAPVLQKEDLLATTISGASASQVAEYVLMMLLALGHHLPAQFEHKQRAAWPKDRWKRFSPLELRDSVVGIVGYGSIGRQVARLCNSFGAVVLGTKRDAMDPEDSGYHPQELGDPGGDLVHRLYPPQALRSMLKESDFVVVSTPLTPATRNLIGAAEFAACKHGAYLIDISRGGVVDHEAMIKALQSGQLAGAALDVFPKEPLPADSPLWKLPNVILTPHVSGVSTSYDQRAVALFTENLYRYLADLPLFNLIDLERGY